MNGNQRSGASAPELVVQVAVSAMDDGKKPPSNIEQAIQQAATGPAYPAVRVEPVATPQLTAEQIAAVQARLPGKNTRLAQAIRGGDLDQASTLISSARGLSEARQYLGVTLEDETPNEEMVFVAVMRFVLCLKGDNVTAWIHSLSVLLPMLWQKNQRVWLERLYKLALQAAATHGDWTHCERLVVEFQKHKSVADNPAKYGLTSDVLRRILGPLKQRAGSRESWPALPAVAETIEPTATTATTAELPRMDPPAETEFDTGEGSPSARYMEDARRATTPSEAKRALTQSVLAENLEALRTQALVCGNADKAKELLAEADELERRIKSLPEER